MRYKSTAGALQEYCWCATRVLLVRFKSTAGALQEYCWCATKVLLVRYKSTAGALLKYCCLLASYYSLPFDLSYFSTYYVSNDQAKRKECSKYMLI